MAISRNPPAFPNDARIQLGDDYQGMTLRDYFAAAALQGLCATLPDMIDPKPSEVVKDAYQFADAMIAERNKRDAQD